MVTIPLGKGAYNRTYGGEPEIKLLNRFFEDSPTNLKESAALLSRPGTVELDTFGDGPIRLLFTQQGAFDNDLFVVSADELYRYDGTTAILITGVVAGTGQPAAAVMAGPGYEYLFIAGGSGLQYYEGDTRARSTLTLTPATPPDIAAQVVRVGDIYYQWATDITPATAAGTVGNPWLVKVGVNDALSLTNMALAINATGTPGISYSEQLEDANPKGRSAGVTDVTIEFRAVAEGTGGNSVVTTVSGGALAFTGGTMADGGVHALYTVETPDNIGIVSLAALKGYVLAVKANSHRFYWIEPGEIIIRPLNFASAESEPDEIIGALAVGDQVWFVGNSTTEPWYATGRLNPAFAPVQGRVYARGVLEGTQVKVQDSVILVGNDGIVYKIGPGVERISTHGIEERIRIQIRREAGLL